MQILKPKKITPGDLIGIIAPASPIKDSQKISNAVNYLEQRGFKVALGKSISEEVGYLAGDDQARLDDLHSMFENKEVKAIFCLRGGYGSIRYIDRVNYKLIRSNPKIFVGFSDITTLQLAIFEKAKLITFAGPMINTYFGEENKSEFVEDQFWNLISSSKKKTRIENPNEEKFYTLSKGRAEGRLLGGNFTSLLALSGTKFLPSFKNSILLLEEINEPPYKIDRMFSMLKQQGILKQVNGIVLGRFIDCYEKDLNKATLTLNQIIFDYLEELKKPIVYNVNHGHVKEMISLPIGANCKINATRGFVEITENVVR